MHKKSKTKISMLHIGQKQFQHILLEILGLKWNIWVICNNWLQHFQLQPNLNSNRFLLREFTCLDSISFCGSRWEYWNPYHILPTTHQFYESGLGLSPPPQKKNFWSLPIWHILSILSIEGKNIKGGITMCCILSAPTIYNENWHSLNGRKISKKKYLFSKVKFLEVLVSCLLSSLFSLSFFLIHRNNICVLQGVRPVEIRHRRC